MAQVILDVQTRTPDEALGRTNAKLRDLLKGTVNVSKETDRLGKSYTALEKGVSAIRSGFSQMNTHLSKMTLLTGGATLSLTELIRSSWEMGKRIMEMRASMKHLSDSTGDVSGAWGVAINAWTKSIASLETIKGSMAGLSQAGVQVGPAMQNLAGFISDIHQASGLSVDSMAKLTGQLHSYWGVSVKGSREVISSVLAAQKAFNMTTSQMEQMIGTITTAQDRLGAFFKDGERGAKALAKGITTATGVMIRMGVNAQTAGDFIDKMLDPERIDETTALMRRLGITYEDQMKMMESAEGKQTFFDKLLDNLPKLSREIQNIQNPYARLNYAKALGLPTEIAAKMATASQGQLRTLVEDYKKQAEGEKAAEDKRKKAQADAARINEQIMFLRMKVLGPMINFVMGMYQKLQKFAGPISTVMEHVVGKIANALNKMVGIIEPVADLISKGAGAKEIRKALGEAMSGVVDILSDALGEMGDILTPIFTAMLKAGVNALFEFIKKSPFLALFLGGMVFLPLARNILALRIAIKEMRGAVLSMGKGSGSGTVETLAGGGTMIAGGEKAAETVAKTSKWGKFGQLFKKGGMGRKGLLGLGILGGGLLLNHFMNRSEEKPGIDTGGEQESSGGMLATLAGTSTVLPMALRGSGSMLGKIAPSMGGKMLAMGGSKAIPVVGQILAALLGGMEGSKVVEQGVASRTGKAATAETKSGGTMAGMLTLGIAPMIDQIFKTSVTEKMGNAIQEFSKSSVAKFAMLIPGIAPVFGAIKGGLVAIEAFQDKAMTAEEMRDESYFKNKSEKGEQLTKEDEKRYKKTLKMLDSHHTSVSQGFSNLWTRIKNAFSGDDVSKSITKGVTAGAEAGMKKQETMWESALRKISLMFDEYIALPSFKTFYGITIAWDKLTNGISKALLENLPSGVTKFLFQSAEDVLSGKTWDAEAEKAKVKTISEQLETADSLLTRFQSVVKLGRSKQGISELNSIISQAQNLNQVGEGKTISKYAQKQIDIWNAQLKELELANKKADENKKIQSAGLGASQQIAENTKPKPDMTQSDFLKTFMGGYGLTSMSWTSGR